MSLRRGKLLPILLILLIPALLYGALKGLLYYKAKRTVDEIVLAAADQADIRYADISTDLRGAVAVHGISVQPLGQEDALGIDLVRVSSDDPLFFIRSAQWQPGENAPPPSMSFLVSGMRVALSADFLRAPAAAAGADAAQPCSQGLQIDPQLLKQIGFSELEMEMDGAYRIDEEARTLDIAMNLELRDIESMRLSARLSDVDIETLSQGGAPQVSLAGFDMALRVAPEFGRQLLKSCAVGSDQTVQAWSEQLAREALAEFAQQGLVLGAGLSDAVHEFYRDWGEIKLVAAPAQPVGLLSLLFLPPEQRARALSLQFSVNDRPVTDTSFTWERTEANALSALLGGEQPESEAAAPDRPRRIIVRRQFEAVPLQDIMRFVDHQVQIKPRGQPLREGVLKRVQGGEAEVEQSVQGGKFTVYVALEDIESMHALIQRQVPSEP